MFRREQACEIEKVVAPIGAFVAFNVSRSVDVLLRTGGETASKVSLKVEMTGEKAH
jgi:hypothetical protein